MHQVITGNITIGSYTAFAQYVAFYEDGFKSLADIWVNFKQTVTATGKFVQLLLRVPQIPLDGGNGLSSCSGRVGFEKVSFSYAGRSNTPLFFVFLCLLVGAGCACVVLCRCSGVC